MPALPLTGATSYGAPRDGGRTHNGIDLPGYEGAPVYAAAAGTVRHAVTTYAPGFSGYGQTVTVDHGDGTHALYGHLSRVLVTVGQRVTSGELLGAVGRTAYTAENPSALTAGPHLHFEAAPAAYPMAATAPRLDPVPWLLAGRVHPREGGPASSSTPEPARPTLFTERAPPWPLVAAPRSPMRPWLLIAGAALAATAVLVVTTTRRPHVPDSTPAGATA